MKSIKSLLVAGLFMSAISAYADTRNPIDVIVPYDPFAGIFQPYIYEGHLFPLKRRDQILELFITRKNGKLIKFWTKLTSEHQLNPTTHPEFVHLAREDLPVFERVETRNYDIRVFRQINRALRQNIDLENLIAFTSSCNDGLNHDAFDISIRRFRKTIDIELDCVRVNVSSKMQVAVDHLLRLYREPAFRSHSGDITFTNLTTHIPITLQHLLQ